MKSKKGFTLIEMLVVIILIGIILAIVLPSVTKLSNNRSKKMYETHLDVVVESAVDLYTDQYKGELADENAECFNINYQTLLKDGLVDETDVFCDGNIIIRDNKSTNSLENSYYLTCRDSKGNEINKSEKVPSGCRGFNGKFKMEYAIYTDSAKTKPYDGTYYVKDAYVVFTSTSPYSFAIDHYEYSIKLDGNWKTIPSGSNLGSIADIKNLDGILNVRAVDQDNNESSSVRIPVKLDNTGPTFTTSMTGGWLEKTVTISEATDKQVGTLAELPYSFDGGQNWQKEPTKNYIENKKINICVRDSLDNKTCKDFEISGIDRVKPDAPTITISDKIGSGSWHKENFTLTLSGASNLSGNTYYYGETNPPKTTGTTISVSEDTTSKVYYLQVCSGAGLCSDVVNYEVKLDKSTPKAPTLAATDGKASGSWHKADTILTASGSSASSGITYYLDKNSNPTTVVTNGSITIADNTESTKYYAKACSGAGKCSSVASYELKLDKSTPKAPTLAATDGIGSGSWHRTDTTFTASGSNALSGITYYLDKNSDPTTVATNGSVTITENTASTKYYAKACSGSGICSDIVSYELKLDKATPQCSIVATGTAGSGGWYTSDVTLTLQVTETISKVASQFISLDKITDNTVGQVITGNVTSTAGIIGNCTATINIDKVTPSAPTIAASDGIGSGSWHKENFNLTLGGANNLSGNTYYYGTTESPTIVGASTTINQNSPTSSGTTYYAKVCSGAGSCSDNSTYVAKLDKISPQCSIQVISGTIGNDNWYVSDVNFEISVTQTVSGVSSKSLNIDKITENTNGTTITGRVMSNAGISESCSIAVKVDKTPPTAPVIRGGNSSLVSSPLTISVQTAGVAFSGIKNYEYYISTVSSTPNSNIAATGITTGNVEINTQGINYIWYRTVSNSGLKSAWSNPQVSNYNANATGTLICIGYDSYVGSFWQYKETITKIVFQNKLNPMTGLLSWDISEEKNGSIMAYYDSSTNTVYIQGNGKIIANSNSSYLFYNFRHLTTIEGLQYLDTTNVTNMRYMFSGCPYLTTLDLNSWNTSKVTSMSYMFFGSGIQSLNLSQWDTSSVSSMEWLFSNCDQLTDLDLSGWNVSKVYSMDYLFNGCESLTTIKGLSQWNVSGVHSMRSMFAKCSSLTTLDLNSWNTSNVTYMESMFQNCYHLKTLYINKWKTSNVQFMSDMFQGCQALTTLDLGQWNTSKVMKMDFLFNDCVNLENLDLSGWDLSKVTDMSYMFGDCRKIITTINILSNRSTILYSGMFSNAALKTGFNKTQITINYTTATSNLVDKMIKTGNGSTSNIVKGTLIQ